MLFNGQLRSLTSLRGRVCYFFWILLLVLLDFHKVSSSNKVAGSDNNYLHGAHNYNLNVDQPFKRTISRRSSTSHRFGNPEVSNNMNYAKVKHRRLRKNKAAKISTNFDVLGDRRSNVDAFRSQVPPSDYGKYDTYGHQNEMDYPVESKNSERSQQFDEPHPEEHKPEQTHQMLDEVKKLEEEIRKLEQAELASAVNKPPNPNATIRANISFPLKWKQYKNLTDVDTMELKYEVSGKDTLTVQIIFFIVFPSCLLILFLYLAITLYWTKCWFWRVVPPDRFYKYERYEIEQDEDPSDLAPLLKTPLQALQEAEAREQARLESVPEEYRTPRDINDNDTRNGPKRPPRRNKERERGNGTDDDFGISDYDTDGRGGRSARTRDRTDDDSTDRDTERQKRRIRR